MGFEDSLIHIGHRTPRAVKYSSFVLFLTKRVSCHFGFAAEFCRKVSRKTKRQISLTCHRNNNTMYTKYEVTLHTRDKITTTRHTYASRGQIADTDDILFPHAPFRVAKSCHHRELIAVSRAPRPSEMYMACPWPFQASSPLTVALALAPKPTTSAALPPPSMRPQTIDAAHRLL